MINKGGRHKDCWVVMLKKMLQKELFVIGNLKLKKNSVDAMKLKRESQQMVMIDAYQTAKLNIQDVEEKVNKKSL